MALPAPPPSRPASQAIAKDVESPFNFLADLHHKQYTAYLQEIKTRVVG